MMSEERLRYSEVDEIGPVSLRMASPDDRLWLAIRYALGELSESDSEQFENCLSADEALCESLIEATRLIESLSVSCEEYHRQRASVAIDRPKSVARLTLPCGFPGQAGESMIGRCATAQDAGRWSLKGFAVLVAVSACLLMVSALNDQSRHDGRIVQANSGDQATGALLNGAGPSAVRAPLPAHDDTVELMVALELLKFYTLEDAGFGAGVPDEADLSAHSPELSVPDWLFAAVELQDSSEADN